MMKYSESEHLKALQGLQVEMRENYEANYLELAAEHRKYHSHEDVGIFDKDILEPLDLIANTDAAHVDRLITKAVQNIEFSIEFLEDDILPDALDTEIVKAAIDTLTSFRDNLEASEERIDAMWEDQ